MEELDLSKFPGQEALLQAGTKDGENKIVRVEGRGAIVYKWAASKMEWEEIGQAVGKGGGKKLHREKVHGVEYDHVTDVVVQEGFPPIQLGFNRDGL